MNATMRLRRVSIEQAASSDRLTNITPSGQIHSLHDSASTAEYSSGDDCDARGRPAHNIAAVTNDPSHAGATASARTQRSLIGRASDTMLRHTAMVSVIIIGARIRLDGVVASDTKRCQVKIDSLILVTTNSTQSQATAVSWIKNALRIQLAHMVQVSTLIRPERGAR